MSRAEFLRLLRWRLAQMPQSEIEKNVAYYDEMFSDMIEDGMTEEEAAARLGDPEEIAKELLRDMPMSELVRSRVRPSGGWTAFSILLAVVLCPIWLPLLIAAAAVVLGLFIALWAVALAVLAVVAALVIGAVTLVGAAIFGYLSVPWGLLTGMALIALGAALLLLLCGRMGLGAFGAGMAMLAREAATLAVLLAYTLRHGELIRPSLRRVRLTRAVFSEIMRSGLPTLLRQGATSVSAALLSRVSAGFGAPVLAGMGLCARAIMPFTSAVIGFGQGFQPVCGAAFGAKQTARCQEAYRFCQRVAIAFSLAAGLAFFVFAPALAARFAPDAQSAEAARRALRLQSVAFPAQSAVILMTMLTQAMGLTLRASLVATSRQALFFLPLLAVLPRLFGLWGLLACQSASDLAALGFSLALTRGLRGSSSARCGCSDARTACRSHPRSSS